MESSSECPSLVPAGMLLDFRCYAAAASQARRMTRISSGVGWSG